MASNISVPVLCTIFLLCVFVCLYPDELVPVPASPQDDVQSCCPPLSPENHGDTAASHFGPGM